MHTIITLSFAAVLFAAPLFASAQTADQLNAQAQALLQQIAQLQQQLGGGSGSSGAVSTVPAVVRADAPGVDSSTCPQIGRVLKMGSSGDDVMRLQQFLARDAEVYPEGLASGYYGGLTQAAVQRWQAKYNVVSSGSPESTGYGVVGPRTAATIALLCSTGAAGGVTSGNQVGGFIQVSPVSGNAPLTVNVQANVNTTKSCGAAVYTLNWGDGTPAVQIPVQANSCVQLTQTFTHVYQYGGTWQITLSAGGHKTNATVTVFGPSGPSSGPTSTNVPVSNGALPADSFSASRTAGSAPLSVVFSGVVTSNNGGWCPSGCSSTLVFGDGQATTIPLPMTANSYQQYSVSHTYASAGTYTATFHQGAPAAGRTPIGSYNIQVGGQASYGIFTVSPGVGGDPQTVSVSFALNSSCAGYDLDWGDSSAHQTQADGGNSCGAVSTTKTFTHQYGGVGSYTITLKRGASLSSVETANVVIQ